MCDILMLVAWLAGMVVFMAFLEYSIHRWLMHKRLLPAVFYRLRFLKEVFYEHASLHHRKYYKVFNRESDPFGREVNLRVSWKTGFAIAIPLCLLLSLIQWQAPVALLLVLIFHHAAWNLIHREMHTPSGSGFSQWPIYRYLARYHFLHHKYRDCNFNVVFPSFDFIFGTHRRAAWLDEAQMRVLGIGC